MSSDKNGILEGICTTLTLLQADNVFNSCRVGKLFSENLHNIKYVQTSQLIKYNQNRKHDNLISNCVS